VESMVDADLERVRQSQERVSQREPEPSQRR
jgi:hypothetical protein